MATQYVNVYQIVMQYGGPEEGGWWYDEYFPMHELCRGFSSRRKHKQAMDRHIDRMRGVCERAHREEHGRTEYSSVNCGHTFGVCVEEHPARHSPDSRPYYC